MDHLSKIREWHDYYKGRYEKAVSLNLVEGDKHYAAFKEIEYRYAGLELAMELFELLPKYIEKGRAEETSRGLITLIMETLFLGEIIRNERGKKEYIWRRVKIKKTDTYMHNAYMLARAAAQRIPKMDYTCPDQDAFLSEMAENLFYLLQWIFMVRETEISVERKKKKDDCA